ISAVFVTGGLPYSADLMTNKHEVDWSKVPLKLGMTMELCGGIIDAKLSDEEIMQKEVWEECGYDVPVQNFERIITYFYYYLVILSSGAVGIHGNKQTIYYAECTDYMDITKRGETVPEGDMIEVVEMSIPQVRELLGDVSKPIAGNCSLGMFWFLANRVPPGT
ncbi:Uridine diphosphate glucose pyrophosphatase, partial [Orchesella cincta]